jgi:hypothetical protein
MRYPVDEPASPEKPIYQAVKQDDDYATTRYMIVCDEGWRQSIVCEDMYDWAAAWMVSVLGRRPYAPGNPS